MMGLLADIGQLFLLVWFIALVFWFGGCFSVAPDPRKKLSPPPTPLSRNPFSPGHPFSFDLAGVIVIGVLILVGMLH